MRKSCCKHLDGTGIGTNVSIIGSTLHKLSTHEIVSCKSTCLINKNAFKCCKDKKRNYNNDVSVLAIFSNVIVIQYFIEYFKEKIFLRIIISISTIYYNWYSTKISKRAFHHYIWIIETYICKCCIRTKYLCSK